MWIFSMIILGIYTVWTIILKATRSGQNAAAMAQRERISIRTIEDALLTAQMFSSNPRNPYYSFVADMSGDFAALSFVARLPASFPGVGRYGDQFVRRVSFYVNNNRELIMTQAPMLMAMQKDFEPYSLALAKDVTLFLCEFWGQERSGEWKWVQEWTSTNQLPKMVRVAVGMGKSLSDGSKPQDVAMRVIALPSMAVPPALQMGGSGMPGMPPGSLPGQTVPGGFGGGSVRPR